MQGLIVKCKKPVVQTMLGIPVTHEMVKALNTGKLVQKKINVTNKAGKTFQVNKWVKPGEAESSGRNKKDPEEVRGSKHGYGMHNIQNGDKISFKSNGKTMMGTVIDDSSLDGLVVKDAIGDRFPVEWKEITGFKPSKEAKQPLEKRGSGSGGGRDSGGRDDVGGDDDGDDEKKFIEPDNFNASDWNERYNEADATEESVMSSFGVKEKEYRDAITLTQKRLERLEQSIDIHRLSGEGDGAVYDAERAKRHQEIVNEILSPEMRLAARPEKGQKPTLTMLGGRGGSGKGWFKNKVYNPNKAIVLDADVIKGKLPEYEGWNAAKVHEESSDILERILAQSRLLGLNIVIDATMKTEKNAMAKAETFKNAGYRIELHYMYLPRQEAAKRAVERFMGQTKRFVPPKIVLGNTENEKNFEKLKIYADAWSFRDNNVKKGQEPKLISEYKS